MEERRGGRAGGGVADAQERLGGVPPHGAVGVGQASGEPLDRGLSGLLEGAGQLAATKLLLHPQGVDQRGDGSGGADPAQRPPRLGRDRVVLVVGEGEDLGDRLGPADLAQGVEHLDPAGPLGE